MCCRCGGRGTDCLLCHSWQSRAAVARTPRSVEKTWRCSVKLSARPLLSTLGLLLALVSFVWRLQFGVNLADEALYVGIPLRFALGATPFVDEYSSVQSFGLATWPLASLFLALQGSTESIVLWFRFVFACMWIGLAACYWLLGRRYADCSVANLLAAAQLPRSRMPP